jgi:AraC family transcriptional regulator, exoenzyme S synthesis regulatory protein ExsA
MFLFTCKPPDMINYYELVKSNPEYFKQFSCNDLLFLNYDCPVELKKAAKWSAHNYIYYVLTGRKTIHAAETSLTLTKGSIAFMKKGACIVEQFYDEPFCVVVFIMPDTFIDNFLKQYAPGEQPTAFSTLPIIPVYDDALIKNFYQSIIPYFVSADNVPADILELKFKELLLYILHNPDNEELRNYLLSLRDRDGSSLRNIMENNYAYNLKIEEYAKMTNRSVSSFKRDFECIYKTTPGRWLMDKKLAHAKRLLISSNTSIADVAFDSGFENTAHFSRMFKQKTELTPMEFRKRAALRETMAV